MKKRIVLPWLIPFLIAACGNEGAGSGMGGGAIAAERGESFSQVAQGGRLFKQYCAECHGTGGEGAPNWRQRDSDGMFPPPPLNGTGHAWHHPRAVLHAVIADGSPNGMGKMPAWRGRLSDEDIDAIIAWFQSHWSEEVYTAWREMDWRSRSGS